MAFGAFAFLMVMTPFAFLMVVKPWRS